MGKLLTILGITDQSNLTEDILTAENLIIGMQYIYENSPESEQKESLAIAIAETIRLTLQQIKGLPLTPPQAPKISNLPRILTQSEFEIIYGANWRKEVALDDTINLADWVSPIMDKYFGTELTQQQIDDLGIRGIADLQNGFVVSPYMTTLNPSYNKNGVQGGDNYQSADGLFKFHIDGVVNGVVFYKQTDEFGVETDEQDNLNIINYLIDNGEWVKVNKQNTPTTEIKVGQVYKTDGGIGANYVILKVDNDEIEWIGITNKNGTGQTNTRKVTEDAISSGFWVLQPQLSVQVGDVFRHNAQTPQNTFKVYEIKNRNVGFKDTNNGKTSFDLQETIGYILNDVWIRVNNQQNTPTPTTPPQTIVLEVDDVLILQGSPNGFHLKITYVPDDKKGGVDLITVGVVDKNGDEEEYETSENYEKIISDINSGNLTLIKAKDVKQPATPKSDTNPLFKIGDKFLVDTWEKNEVGIITSITDKIVNYDFSYDKGLAWESGNNFPKSNFEKWLKKGEVVILPTPKPTAKKGTRQSPITSATAVKEGTKMKGNDGNFWVARKTSAGYNQWKKIK